MMKLSAESKTKIQKDKELEAQKKAPQLILRAPVKQLINFIVLTRDPIGIEYELHLNNNGLDVRRGFWVEIAPDDDSPGLIAPDFILKYLKAKIRIKQFLSPPMCLSRGYDNNSIPISLWVVYVPWEVHTDISFQYRLKTTATPVYLSWVPKKKNALKNFMALCV